jgi:hypothetical protein
LTVEQIKRHKKINKTYRRVKFPVKNYTQDIANINERKYQIKYLVEKGCVYQDIADYYGISRQRVHQLLINKVLDKSLQCDTIVNVDERSNI